MVGQRHLKSSVYLYAKLIKKKKDGIVIELAQSWLDYYLRALTCCSVLILRSIGPTNLPSKDGITFVQALRAGICLFVLRRRQQTAMPYIVADNLG